MKDMKYLAKILFFNHYSMIIEFLYFFMCRIKKWIYSKKTY